MVFSCEKNRRGNTWIFANAFIVKSSPGEEQRKNPVVQVASCHSNLLPAKPLIGPQSLLAIALQMSRGQKLFAVVL